MILASDARARRASFRSRASCSTKGVSLKRTLLLPARVPKSRVGRRSCDCAWCGDTSSRHCSHGHRDRCVTEKRTLLGDSNRASCDSSNGARARHASYADDFRRRHRDRPLYPTLLRGSNSGDRDCVGGSSGESSVEARSPSNDCTLSRVGSSVRNHDNRKKRGLLTNPGDKLGVDAVLLASTGCHQNPAAGCQPAVPSPPL